MPRTQRILGPGEPRGEIADTLLLKFDDRCRQQGFAFGGKGTCVEFDFPAPPRLRTDDLLVLDDGRLAEVVADAEPVLEVSAHENGHAHGHGDVHAREHGHEPAHGHDHGHAHIHHDDHGDGGN